MTAPYPRYRADQERPHAFLGRRVELPELDGWVARPWLEAPIDSVERLIGFAEAVDGWEQFYRQRLTPSHWGVWQARHLEAALWRIQDAFAPQARLPRSFGPQVWAPSDGGDPPTRVEVWLSYYSSTGKEFLKDMVLSYLRPDELDPNRRVVVPVPEPWGEASTGEVDPIATREGFWRPVSVWCVAEAIDAWDACRGGSNRLVVPHLAKLGWSWQQGFATAFGPQVAAAMREQALSAALPAGAARGSPTPRL